MPILGLIAGLYQDLLKPVYYSLFNKPANFIYIFPELNSANEKDKNLNFSGNDLSDIIRSFHSPLKSNARCPCGSGKPYVECHSPKINRNDENPWKGPGFQKTIFFGSKEPVNGIEFQKKSRGEINLLKNKDKISLGKYFTMDYSILLNKAIIRSLSIKEENKELIFSGLVEIYGESNSSYVQIIIGTSNLDLVTDFEANTGGKKIFYERGCWMGFIGEPVNPLEGIKKQQWYRYFIAEGFLVEFKPTTQLYFKLSKKIAHSNFFTLSLPFNNVEITHPKIITRSHFSKVIFELEREKIYWDLVVHSGQYDEIVGKQKDSILLTGISTDKIDAQSPESFRKMFSGPRKIRISLQTDQK